MNNPSARFYVAALITGISLLFIFIFLAQRSTGKFKEATFETGIDTVLVTGNEFFGAGRGTIPYSSDNYIQSAARLIENKSGFSSWKSNGPVFDFDTIPHQYTLDDLRFPFKIHKKPASDTILVLKDGIVLKFFLVRYE